jgi:hypothetical protein
MENPVNPLILNILILTIKDVQDVEKNKPLKSEIFLDKYSYKILLIL